MAGQVEDLRQEVAKAAELAQSREDSHQGMSRQLDSLHRIAEDDRPWEQVCPGGGGGGGGRRAAGDQHHTG
ncbi:hypothetical protein, partial [Arthrobacter sp. MAHUQ-56]